MGWWRGRTLAAQGFPLAYLQCPKFKQVFLGNVHDPVQLGNNCRYIGSLLQIDYRDAGKKRGFVIYDPQGKVEFVENTVSPRYHIVGGGGCPRSGGIMSRLA